MTTVKAWGLAIEDDRLLVQYATDESLFRLPGGTVERDEYAADALAREMREEFDLVADVGPLVTTWENVFSVDGRTHHEIVLIHRLTCVVPDGGLTHREHPDIRLEWWPVAQLAGRPTAPSTLGAIAADPPPHLR